MKKKILLLLLISTVYSIYAQEEIGIASYYGTEFNGRPTANGEIYSENKLTAAHKTLKLGTVVKVTNLQNNKSVLVKINDRGPFVKGRIIDLSTKAAAMLGYRNNGTTKVKIEVIQPNSVPKDLLAASLTFSKNKGKDTTTYDSVLAAKNSIWKDIPTVLNEDSIEQQNKFKITKEVPQPTQPLTEVKVPSINGILNKSPYIIITRLDKTNVGFWGIQLGVFSDLSILFAMMDELEAQYKQTILIQQAELEGKIVYKLYIGKFQNRSYADALKSTLSDKFKDAFVTKYE